ncbi:MAG: ATP-binding protein [Pseudomonadota bacterium]
MKTVRIFVSSPGDVGEERLLAHRVIKRLQGELSGQVRLESIFWEQEPLLATSDFQAQIPHASKTDIAVFVLWSRLGTPLSAARISRPDGTRYDSGTEYEFEDAVSSFQARGLPSILVYKKTAEPVTTLKTKQEVLERLAQKDALDAFVERWFIGSDGSFTAAFHPYGTSAQFEERLEEHLRKLIASASLDNGGETTTGPSTLWEASPFRGLEVFEYIHAPIFFGRTQAVGEILNALRKQAAAGCPFLLILGMSGIGKSSLVRAGVLPSLTQPGVIEGIEAWRYAVMRPSDSAGDLFDGLAAALIRDPALPRLASELQAGELAASLRASPSTVASMLKIALSDEVTELKEPRPGRQHRAPIARLALLIDQLEEIFTLKRIAAAERKAFIAALKVLVECGWIWVIATLRSDFYHRCAEITELQDLKSGTGTYDLKPPSSAEIFQIIRQPTRLAGLRFEEQPETGARLDDELHTAVTRNPGALPLLEFTLQELFNLCRQQGKLTFAAYNSLGGVEGALAKRAESIYSGLPASVQSQLPTVLSGIVELGQIDKKTPVRRYAPLDSIAGNDDTRCLVDAFVQGRLFITDRSDDGTAVVSVAHEALLYHWPRLQEWIEQNRDYLFQRTTLTEASNHWGDSGKLDDLLLELGTPLDSAEALMEKRRDTFSGMEMEYVRKSTGKRRSRGKYAWLGGFVCWTLVWGAAFRTTEDYVVSTGLSDFFLNNWKLLYLVSLIVLPFGWVTLEKWRAQPLTRTLSSSKIFWTLYAIAIVGYLATFFDDYQGDFYNVLLILLTVFWVFYLAGRKWMQSRKRNLEISETQLIANRSRPFVIAFHEFILLGFWLLIGVIIAWYALQQKSSVEYYTSFARRHGIPEGIGRVDANQLDRPRFAYKFHRNGEDQVIRVQQENQLGHCGLLELKSYLNLAESLGFSREACVFEYTYNADGSIST